NDAVNNRYSFNTSFFSSRRRHTRFSRDWSSDVCSSDLGTGHAFTIDTSPTEMRIAFTTGLTLTSAPTTATAGETITVTASVLDHEGQPLAAVSSRLTLTSSVPTDIISGNPVPFPTASPHPVPAAFRGHSRSPPGRA